MEHGRPSADASADLCRALAALHDAGAGAFGAAPPGGPELAWIGNTRMRNAGAGADWSEWYAEDRVRP